ncbi:MAG: thiamine-phosphate kinase [Bacillota bacterium]
MELKEMGEFALIKHLTRKMRSYDGSVFLGIGDDAASFRVAAGRYLVVTCDMLVEGHHFRRVWTTAEQLGHKALAVSLSDIAAMGGVPRYALISAGWPSDVNLDYAEGIYRGIRELAEAYGVFIIGGDTVGAPQLILDVTVIGEMEAEPVTRSGALPGHVFAVMGSLGASAAGLALLQARGPENGNLPKSGLSLGKEPSPKQLPAAAWAQTLIGAHLLPQPRVREAAALLKTVRPSAMIDISDGLASEIHHICEGSTVGAEIDIHSLPVHQNTKRAGETLGRDYLEWVLYGGEDYELLVTLPPGDVPAVQKVLGDYGTSFTVIGRVVAREKGIKLLKGDGKTEDLNKQGYDHFSAKPPLCRMK